MLALFIMSFLLVAIGFGLAIGVQSGFFLRAQHPLLRLEPPTWVPAFGGIVKTDTYLVTGQRAGPLSIGMLLSVLSRQIEPWSYEVVPKRGAQGLAEHYVIRDARGDILAEAVPACENVCRIGQITLLSPRFLTGDGLRVGSTFGEVIAFHGITNIVQRAGVYVVSTQSGIMYAVQSVGVEGGVLETSDIPGDAVVEYILLVSD